MALPSARGFLAFAAEKSMGKAEVREIVKRKCI